VYNKKTNKVHLAGMAIPLSSYEFGIKNRKYVENGTGDKTTAISAKGIIP
jgi:hypothetical protein